MTEITIDIRVKLSPDAAGFACPLLRLAIRHRELRPDFAVWKGPSPISRCRRGRRGRRPRRNLFGFPLSHFRRLPARAASIALMASMASRLARSRCEGRSDML
jgi:hypothetical protein